MQNTVLLEMYERERDSHIASHKFYVDQAKKRILSQFENLDSEIEDIAQEIFNKSGDFFNPDYDDPADYAERAYEQAQEHLMLLSEMREQALFSIIAGMFHQFDKTLREWVERESRFWAGSNVKKELWMGDIGKIYTLFENFGWTVRQEAFFKEIDACRLVVNVYKHGKGNSLGDLRIKYPEYFYDYKDPNFKVDDWYDHTSIIISEDQFNKFSESIISFWKAIPRRFMNAENVTAPPWLDKALNADNLL